MTTDGVSREKFTAATNKNYDRKQHRNCWDIVKKEWQIWDALVRRETRLGWNVGRQTIEAANEWWEAKLQEVLDKLATHPGCQPMSHLFKLGIRLFTKKANRETFVALSEPECQLE
ncbi:hypothetical protein CISIN_1g042135mg, partial [Citrus sinensis]